MESTKAILLALFFGFVFGMVLHFGTNTAKMIWQVPELTSTITVEHVPAKGYEFVDDEDGSSCNDCHIEAKEEK